MRIREIIVDLPVEDIDAARGFYTDFLGLATEEFNLGWVARFTDPDSGQCVQVVTPADPAPERPAVSIKVDDVDAAYAEAVALGLDIVQPLTDEEWGVRRFYVRAPDGNVFNIVRHRA